jgi:small subunit ribosomal protein S17
MPKKNLKGIVVSAKMNNTAVISVEIMKEHPRYRKRYRVNRKYMADNPNNNYQEGDQVVIEECRPLSRHKRWRIIGQAT